MPKHEAGSAKAIANKQKSIGLQRLRWYCQMCQKQCRDENGFKCHTMSESHLRQMRVFADNPSSVLDEFSQEFERGYLETLSSLHGTKRVKANTVYQEYIADKHHIHMNATVWTTLTGFCMHLGKESKAIVDETEKGWFIQYIDRDPKVLARQAQADQRQKFELDEEERRKREIAAQVQAAEERRRAEGYDSSEDAAVDNSLVRNETDQKIAVALAPVVTTSLGLKKRPRQDLGFGADSDEDDNAGEKGNQPVAAEPAGFPGFPPARKGSAIAQMIQEDEQRKRARAGAPAASSQAPATGREQARELEPPASTSRSNGESRMGTSSSAPTATSSSSSTGSNKPATKSWLYKHLVVKIVSKDVHRGRLYKLKGRIVRLLGRDYDEAEVEVDGAVYAVHMRDLETVIPKPGQELMIVRGRAAGSEGELLRIHEEKYTCDVRVTQRGSELYGKELCGLEYEEVCKFDP